MLRKTVLMIISALFLVGMLFFVLVVAPDLDKEELDLKDTKVEVLNEIKETKDYVAKTESWMQEEGTENVQYINPPQAENEKGDPKKDVVKFFITGLLANDVDIFLSSFYPESISKDLFKNDNPNKAEVAEEIIKKISRNGQLKRIKFDIKKGFLNSESNTISLNISYADGQKAAIELNIITLGDSHHDEEENIYVITTSAWDIIGQIKTSTE